MSEPKYQVQIAEGLSKAYDAHKLRLLRDRKQIDDESACTPDGGKTWVTLGSLLAKGSSQSLVVATKQSSQPSEIDRSSAAPDPQVDDRSDRPKKMTAEEMFERRGRLSPTRPLTNSQPLPEPTSTRPSKSTAETGSNRSDASEIALRTIQSQIQVAAQRREIASDSSAPRTTAENRTRFSFLRPMATGALGGVIATAILFSFLSANSMPDSHSVVLASVLSGQDLGPVVSDQNFQTMTPAELTARIRILGVQLNHVARKLSVDVDAVAIPAASGQNHTPSAPLLPYLPPARSAEQTSELKTLLDQYAKLVRAKGADGRKMDPGTVTRFTDRLAKLIASPGTPESTRAEAAHDVAEKCKLLYLLQLSNTRSTDPAQRQTGRAILFDAANAGLGALFAEYAAQDMGYVDIIGAADADVQPELILIRYWCHRCTDIASADEWMEQMLRLCKDEHIAYVNESIIEADRIEQLDR